MARELTSTGGKKVSHADTVYQLISRWMDDWMVGLIGWMIG